MLLLLLLLHVQHVHVHVHVHAQELLRGRRTHVPARMSVRALLLMAALSPEVLCGLAYEIPWCRASAWFLIAALFVTIYFEAFVIGCGLHDCPRTVNLELCAASPPSDPATRICVALTLVVSSSLP